MIDHKSKRSCSTMVAVAGETKNGDVIFAKNSDRPVNEAQPLCFYPSMEHSEGSIVKCTYISIPQVKHTYSCIGSRPYNLFGFEHGINECGVIIGNEAVLGKERPEARWGLLGMDILRITLERASSAAEGVEIAGWLLEKYGTGGDPLYRAPYFNANFIIADPREAYIFESCQRYWAAKKVDGVGHLSNCYCIRDNYDLIGGGVAEELVKKGWSKKAEKIDIANAFAHDDGDYSWAEGYFRYVRQEELLKDRRPVTLKSMMENLRDHYSEENRRCIPYSVAAAKLPSICCHPGGITGAATAASVVCSLNAKGPEPFKFTYWGSMAPPCCSIFKPIFNIKWIPEELQNASGIYDERSHWWTFIELERYVALNYELFAPEVRERFNQLENEFIEQVDDLQKNYDGNVEKLRDFSGYANAASTALAKELLEKVKNAVSGKNVDALLINYFKDSAKGCGMECPNLTVESF